MSVASLNSRRAVKPRLSARANMPRFSAKVTLLRNATPRSSACVMSRRSKAVPRPLPCQASATTTAKSQRLRSSVSTAHRETPTIRSPSPSTASAKDEFARQIDAGPVLQLGRGRMAARQEPEMAGTRRQAVDESPLDLEVFPSDRPDRNPRAVAQLRLRRIRARSSVKRDHLPHLQRFW
jgi:hypothetical protein